MKRDYWFFLPCLRWCWKCWRLTMHMNHTAGSRVCVRCALLND